MLTEAESAQAIQNGWLVCDVYDLTTTRWIIQVLPVADSPIKSAAELFRVIAARASMNDPLARRIVNLVMNSYAPPTAKKGRKK